MAKKILILLMFLVFFSIKVSNNDIYRYVYIVLTYNGTILPYYYINDSVLISKTHVQDGDTIFDGLILKDN